ncbi:MAG: hypothetical protein ACPL68_03150 [Candidatus Hydrothermia bacterium]
MVLEETPDKVVITYWFEPGALCLIERSSKRDLPEKSRHESIYSGFSSGYDEAHRQGQRANRDFSGFFRVHFLRRITFFD